MSLALYRRYRPETFDEVIGQDHVTGPLGQALASGRVHHAFLFSGPRGCGKTTSARILARALNCEQGPTPTPCGKCQSCQDLANGGPGSLDVIEIDAASHGGVDDARDLRERAFYAPVSSRYKVYIIDEAHMVTREGFNALLKLVEEPPDHVKFVFATTEPDKVLATIRSRTHHYAFRLVAPRILSDHLARVAAEENVTVEDAVLPMVVRAGAGSVRDALSVLDQLIAGSTENTISMSYASGLLGYTDGQLLDDVIDAFAARRGANVFETLDRALDSGLDPRRFVADLLERFRDLLILTVAGADTEHLDALITAAPDELDRMKVQASHFGLAELTRNAEVLSEGLVEMRGATSPRLLLEIMAARLLLPGADDADRGLQVRVEQLERQSRQAAAGRPAPAPAVVPAPVMSQPVAPTTAPVVADDVSPAEVAPAKSKKGTQAAATGTDVEAVRRKWPEIVEEIKNVKRSAWIQLNRPGSGVLSVDQSRVAVGLPDVGTAKGFVAGGYDQLLATAISQVMGSPYTVDVIGQPVPDSLTVAGLSSAPAAAPAEPTPATGPKRKSGRDIIEAEKVAQAEPAAAVVDDTNIETDETELVGEALITAAFDAKSLGELESDS
ncbi:MAG: DNA polymerase III subunit gamma and tau [Actinobacteria bacterium]|uniref:DNA-directed DNA polymerase n=1 Tax=freshwater metagenome TaxID=449393 RepID=A0A6J6VGI9_9ZZZZ|nr:DNA polymerase III subunit gamma and tau [Actinomycetota bacterium]